MRAYGTQRQGKPAPLCLLYATLLTSLGNACRSESDPLVWSGRALQEGFVELAVGGLASMYAASGRGSLLRAIMEISAPAISLADRPPWAMWVTSARRRREDRSSISSHPLADLGG